jgi:hypothetical protein
MSDWYGNQRKINDNIDFEADYNDEYNRLNKLGPYSEEELMPIYQTESNGYSFKNHYGCGFGAMYGAGFGSGYGWTGGNGGQGSDSYVMLQEEDSPDLGPLDNNFDDEWLQHEQFDAQYEQDNYEYYS